ncbi:MAG: hypothetical protein ABI833_17190 [Acidobacteriota bacterium]
MAADAACGKAWWEFPANQGWHASAMTYLFDNRQYVAIASGLKIIAFAPPEEWAAMVVFRNPGAW